MSLIPTRGERYDQMERNNESLEHQLHLWKMAAARAGQERDAAVAGESLALEVIADLVQKIRRIAEATDYSEEERELATQYPDHGVYANKLERKLDEIRDVINEDAEQRS